MRRGLYEQGFIIDESKVHLKSDKKEALHKAIEEIKRHRNELIKYIKKYPEFQYALEPVEVLDEAPEIVQMMVGSSRTAKVGPMAGVAGALADIGMRAMLKKGADTAVVEDGGEIAAFTTQPISIVVSLLSSSTVLSGKIGFQITKEDCPLGIATSSSKTGHALSFGEADSVTVIAKNASLADAAATAICNSVVGENIEESIQQGLRKAQTIKGVRGVIIIRGDRTGLWGKLPKTIKVE